MHKDLSSRRVPYRGVLYVGLMIDEHGDPYVVNSMNLATLSVKSQSL